MEGSGDYISALRNTEEYSYPPIGLIHTNVSGTIGQDKVILAQNNVIISLLIELHAKINTMLARTEQYTPINPELEKILLMVEKLKVGETKRPTTGPLRFATNKPPTE